MEADTAHFKGTLKVWVTQICGDSMGLNSALGYIGSFSGNSVCCWCHVEKQIMHTQAKEDPSIFRNKYSRSSDLVQSNPTDTGLKRQCFEEHEILPYSTRCHVRVIDQVNSQITSYDNDFCDSPNKPSTIRPHELKTPNSAMKQTAAQMWCLLRPLPLMMGDVILEH